MPKDLEKANILTLRVSVNEEAMMNAFLDWEAKLSKTISAYPGFLSLETLHPKEKSWVIVQRFLDKQSALDWSTSLSHEELMGELKKLTKNPMLQEELARDSNFQDSVTEVFIAHVLKGKEEAFREWCARTHRAEACWPGFLGAYVQSPVSGSSCNWVTLIQFTTIENLENWLNSSERQELLEESKQFTDTMESHRVISPYAGWFASLRSSGELPSVWKQTMIVLLVLFPIVMIELKYLIPYLNNLDYSLATFIANAISVSLISWPLMPIAILFLGWWLAPKGKQRISMTVLGTLVVVLLYLIEIWIFWEGR